MSETGFTENGFFPRTRSEIYNDYSKAASGVYEEINFGPGSLPYQFYKIIGTREREMELMMSAAVSGLVLDSAYGIWIEKMGNDLGVFRKGPQKAGGHVRVTVEGPDPSTTPYDLKGAYFEGAGLKFYRSETGTSQKIRAYIPIVRSKQNYDGLPSPHVALAGTGFVNEQSNGSGDSYVPNFNPDTDLFDWSSVSPAPSTGATYYVGISGFNVTVKQDIAAAEAGTGHNVGANAITKMTSTSLPTSATINNPDSVTGGSDYETYEALKARIKKRLNTHYTTNEIISECNQIQGVRGVRVYQALGDDRISISGAWSNEASNYDQGKNITGFWDDISGDHFNQRFSPGDGILGFKAVTFRGKRIGNPRPLKVGLRDVGETNWEATGIFDTYDVDPPANTMQDIKVPIDYLDIEANETYQLDIWCKTGVTGSGAPADYWDSNYWVLATGSDQSGNLGETSDPAGDTYTGMLYYGGSSSGAGTNLVFKTHYGGAAVNIDVAVKDGYVYSDLETTIDSKLDWVEGGGNMPIGVDYSINQADPIYIYFSVEPYYEDDTEKAAAEDRLDNSVENYVENLDPTKNVVYSELYKLIMQDTKVWRIDNLEIWESGEAVSSGEDIHVGNGEVAVFGGSTYK